MKMCVHIYVQGAGYHIKPRFVLGRDMTGSEYADAILEHGYYGAFDVTTRKERMAVLWLIVRSCFWFGKVDDDSRWIMSDRRRLLSLLWKAHNGAA